MLGIAAAARNAPDIDDAADPLTFQKIEETDNTVETVVGGSQGGCGHARIFEFNLNYITLRSLRPTIRCPGEGGRRACSRRGHARSSQRWPSEAIPREFPSPS